MKKIFSMLLVLGLIAVGGSAYASSDAACNAKYAETVYDSSTETCVCPTDKPLGWNKYTYCGFMNGAVRVNIKQTTTEVKKTNETKKTISTSPKKESKVVIKLKDRKCKKQNSDSYYDSNSKKCIQKEGVKKVVSKKEEDNNPQNVNNNKDFYDVYACYMHNQRLIQTTINDINSYQSYNSVNQYGSRDLIKIPSGTKPKPETCLVYSVYQCNINGRENINGGQMTASIIPNYSTKYSSGKSYNLGSIVYTERTPTTEYPNNKNCNQQEKTNISELNCSDKIGSSAKNGKCVCPSGMERNPTHQCSYIYDRRFTNSGPNNNLTIQNISAVLESQDENMKTQNYKVIFEIKNSGSEDMILSPEIYINCKNNDYNVPRPGGQLLQKEAGINEIKAGKSIKIYSSIINVGPKEFSQSEDASILLKPSKCIINAPRDYIRMDFNSMRKAYSNNLGYEYFDGSIYGYITETPKTAGYDRNGDLYRQRYYETNYQDNTWEGQLLK